MLDCMYMVCSCVVMPSESRERSDMAAKSCGALCSLGLVSQPGSPLTPSLCKSGWRRRPRASWPRDRQ
eukprot:7127823-Prymnesium_polylepis.2